MAIFPLSSSSSSGNSQLALLLLICATSYALLGLSCYCFSGGDHRSKSNLLETQIDHFKSSPELIINIKRSDFSNDFVFGTTTSAAQIEGSEHEGGRGPSNFDDFLQKYPDRVVGGNKQKTGIDSYKRYKEDVKIIKDVGLDAYKFSISWTRILPNGTLSGGINQEGIDHYNSLIDEIIKQGITPFATLFHFDPPQALQDKYGGPLSRSFVDDFKDYAEICFKEFGDRVKTWFTVNEPLIIAKFGHAAAMAPPLRCSDRTKCVAGNSSTEPYIVSHNLLLAHATVVRLYKQKFYPIQRGKIGISNVGRYYEPYNADSPEDRLAAKRGLDFELGWYMEPLVYGDYPKIMRKIVKDRLPTFSNEEKKMIKGSFDFIGINYYTTRYAKSLPIDLSAPPALSSYIVDEFLNATEEKDGVPIGPLAGGSFFVYIYPPGLYKILRFIKRYYKNPPIYITENGVTEKRNDTLPLNVQLKDQHRIDFIVKHLDRVHEAIEDGVNVKGYFYWTIFDDFEWTEGFRPRFGLYYTDYNHNFTRIPKDSAKWFQAFLRGRANGESIPYIDYNILHNN